jgi:hypothetical protein
MSTLDLEPALMNLYAESGDENYLDFCISDRTLEDWDRPIIEGRWGRIEGHIYDYLSRCIAQLTLMRWQPAFGLTRTASRAIDYMVSGDGMMITGELGDHECWHASQEGTIHLGETCATAYLIRLLHHLLRQTRDPFYGDLMERAIYNALFAAQSPDGRRIRYYTPIEGPREYFGPDTYCCPNNFRRIASELPEMLWYQTSDGFLLNLFSDSVVKSKSPDGTVVQLNTRTVYPSEGRIEVEVVPDRPCQFSIDVRIPRWCRAPIVRTNGSSADRSVDSGSLHRIARVWTPGDTIELELPMPIRMIAGRKAQSGRAAFMRGPSVFCLSTNRQKDLDNNVVKLLIFDPSSATESTMENSIRPGGGQIEIDAWSKDSWYPSEAPDLSLTLSEFPDPEGELVYLKTPVPNDRRAGSDELLGAGRRRISSGVGDYYSDTIAEEYSDEANAKTLRRLQS